MSPASIPSSHQPPFPRDAVLLAAVLVPGAAFLLALLLRVDVLAGPSYWRHAWLDFDLARAMLLSAPALLLVLAVLHGDPERGPRTRIALLMVACFLLQLGSSFNHPDALERLRAIIQSPIATSYFTDAVRIVDVRAWLAGFHQATLQLHSSTHPPGPILFHRGVLWLFGPAHAPLAAALAIGALSTVAIPLLWSCARLFTASAASRLHACAMYALLPALAAHLPEFDQAYPLFTLLIVKCWIDAVDGSRRAAFALAPILFLATLFAWNLLALAVFTGLHAAWRLWRDRGDAATAHAIARSAAVALGGMAVLYLAMWAATGYRPIASLAHALEVQAAHAALLPRPWRACVAFDLYDFLLGAGMLAAPLAWLYLLRGGCEAHAARDARVVAAIGLVTIGLVDLSGLLRAETARVWLFLQPFLILPAGLALAYFGRIGRTAAIVLQWLLVVAIASRLSFVSP